MRCKEKADIWQNLRVATVSLPSHCFLGMFHQRISDFPLFRNKTDKKKKTVESQSNRSGLKKCLSLDDDGGNFFLL